MSEIRFDERVVVITGAGSGLGETYARLLARRGARVLINDLGFDQDGSGNSVALSQKVAASIVAEGGAAVADVTDVRAPGAGSAIIGSAFETWGRIDALINNAGYVSGDFDDMFEIHVRGATSLIKAAWPLMARAGYGRIVNTVSSAGLFGLPGARAYSTAKAALMGLTKSLAAEGLGLGITVNALAPVAATSLTRIEGDDWLRKTCPPALVAPVAAWLVHECCAVTGEIFSAGAGRVARVFVAEGPGHQSEDLAVEGIRDNFHQIMDTGGFEIPRSAADEMRLFGWTPPAPGSY